MYEILYSKQSIKTLRKLPKNISNRIRINITELANNPFKKTQTKSLNGTGISRLRVGDWRIIYSINKNKLEIWIIKIAPRGKVYKK